MRRTYIQLEHRTAILSPSLRFFYIFLILSAFSRPSIFGFWRWTRVCSCMRRNNGAKETNHNFTTFQAAVFCLYFLLFIFQVKINTHNPFQTAGTSTRLNKRGRVKINPGFQGSERSRPYPLDVTVNFDECVFGIIVSGQFKVLSS